MGISDLVPFLKKNVPNCFVRVPATNFNNRRIAIDGHNWLFTYLGSSVKYESQHLKDPMEGLSVDKVFISLVREFLKFNIKLLNYKITPVWIWDGTSMPAKKETKDKRREERQKRIDKRNNLKNILSDMSVLERPTELLDQYKKLQIDTFYFPGDRIDELKRVSKRIGLPTITAKSEGEHLASSLAVERYVACVWSSDTDTYVLGAPFVTRKIDYTGKDMYIEGVFTLAVLKQLGLTHQEFRDFCIMCGCDFGNRMKGVGPKRSMELIQKYRSIEEINANNPKLDISCLNYEECRRLLTPTVTEIDEEDLNVTKEEYEEDLDKYKLKNDFDVFFSRTRNLRTPENVPK